MLDKLSKILQNNTVLKILAFLISFVLFLIITQTGSPFWQDIFQETQVISDVSVTTQYDKDKYYISGLPDKMPITIKGSENQLIAAKNQTNAMNVVIDLNGYEPGQYQISSSDMNFDVPAGVKATSVISEYEITIQKRGSQSFPLELTYADTQLKDGFMFDNPKLANSYINIVGGTETLSTIANVQAIVDLNGLDTTKASGSANLNAEIKAYDVKGNIIEDIEMEKSTVGVEINYNSETKEVPISYQFSGQGDEYVASICPSGETCDANTQSTLKIFGDEEKVKEVTDVGTIKYNIDLSKVNQDTGKVPGVAILPKGVFIVGGNSREFDVKLEPGVSKTVDVNISTQGLNSKFSIKAVDKNSVSVPVEVTGASSVINSLTPEDIVASIDLSKVTEPGEYEVPITIQTSKPINYTQKTQVIKITIVEQ